MFKLSDAPPLTVTLKKSTKSAPFWFLFSSTFLRRCSSRMTSSKSSSSSLISRGAGPTARELDWKRPSGARGKRCGRAARVQAMQCRTRGMGREGPAAQWDMQTEQWSSTCTALTDLTAMSEKIGPVHEKRIQGMDRRTGGSDGGDLESKYRVRLFRPFRSIAHPPTSPSCPATARHPCDPARPLWSAAAQLEPSPQQACTSAAGRSSSGSHATVSCRRPSVQNIVFASLCRMGGADSAPKTPADVPLQ